MKNMLYSDTHQPKGTTIMALLVALIFFPKNDNNSTKKDDQK